MNTTDVVSTLITGVLLPVIVAILTYTAIDGLGEWRKRRTSSRLGVAIIETLQEEIRTGIQVMTDALKNAEDPNAPGPLDAALPNRTWSGMTTIPDDVLLRIIETSLNRKFVGFPPRECRIHCKNYFEYMPINYEGTVGQSAARARSGQDWRGPIRDLLADNTRRDSTGNYIRDATKVDQMLEHARQLLDENSKARRPK
jgi:hypothetical protein